MELLAPAGTFDCLKVAVNSGADAVYFAGQAFGARSYAGNFTDNEIFRAVDFCHLRSARAYITLNTVVFDREYKELERFIKVLTKAGVDGVIVQDLGVLDFVRQLSPDMEIHASTQMTVHSADGVKALENMGVSRVVLSRELSYNDMKKIIATTSAEAEVFVHGAMCMSYSGQCLMSSVIGGRSGNRGKCAQPCRLPYGNDKRFYLSLKDMSLADHIKELDHIGVSSLKIEGRMKGEAYVASVVSAYRRLIDEERKPTEREKDELNSIFFRGGLTDGYFQGKTGADMFAFDKPDNPYLKNDNLVRRDNEKQREITIEAEFCRGERPLLTINCEGTKVTVLGEATIERASNRPATKESIEGQLRKTGGTAFVVKDVNVVIKGSLFVPVSYINELRRQGIEKLEKEITDFFKNKRINNVHNIYMESTNKQGFTCLISNIAQYKAIKDFGFKRIYIPMHIAKAYGDEIDKNNAVVTMPAIIRENDRDSIRNIMGELRRQGFVMAEISTIDGLALADGFEIYASQRMNITNSCSLKKCYDMGIMGVCLSPELNLGQIRDMQKGNNTEIIVYGRIPLMITENCILNNMGKCKCNGYGEVIDRTGRVFPVFKDGEACRSVILNSVPLYMGDKLSEITRLNADMRILFTIEKQDQCKKICDDYINNIKADIKEYTRLQLLKGALE